MPHNVFFTLKGRGDLWRLLPAVLAALSIIITLFIWRFEQVSGQSRNKQYFDALVTKVQVELENRYLLYEQSLRGGLGLFHVSERINRSEWHKYVKALNIEESLPGINGIGYIDYLLTKDLEGYLHATRKNGFPDFTNHPNTFYPDKFITSLIEPIGKNAKVVGLDIGFEANRRTAAERARDLGVPAITKKIHLVQDLEKKAGFLLLLPRYKGNAIPSTLRERRESFLGWVYAPFIGSDFLSGLTEPVGNQISLTVYDSKRAVQDALIYAGDTGSGHKNKITKSTRFQIAGHIWTITWSTTPLFIPPSDGLISSIILVIGLLFSLFLWVMLTVLVHQKVIIANEVEKQTLRLETSDAKIKAIVDNTFDGLITIDGLGTVETYNKACEEIFGYLAREVIGKNIKMLMPEPYHGEHDAYLKHYGEIGEKKIIGTNREVQGRRRDGTVFPVDLSVSEVNIHGRKLYCGTVRDITERKRAEKESAEANAELEEFSYRTSHDLRSPLISSISLLTVAKNAIDVSDKALAITSLGHAQKSLEKLEELVKDILDLTQIKNDGEEAQEVDVAHVVSEALLKFEYMDGFDRLKIIKGFEYTKPINTKKTRFTLIVENLISNAIKYQDLDKKDSFIKVETYQKGREFVLGVTDNGIGIPKDQQDRMFQMFKRFHPKVSFGSGLGLYMMKKSADALNASIMYEDTGDGSSFKLIIDIGEER